MYHFSTFLDRSIMACSVAPPCDPLLDASVRDLSVAHFIIAGRHTFQPFTEAIAHLSDDQIDRGRLQWLHTIKEMRDALNEHRFASTEHNPHRQSLPRLVALLAKTAVQDIDAIAQQCAKTPGKTARLTVWPQALAILAQACVVAQTMRTVTASTSDVQAWTDLAQELEETFKDRVERCTAFYRRVGPAYDEVQNALVGVSGDALMEQAHQDVLAQASVRMDLGLDRMNRVLDLLGPRDLLWTIVQNAEKREQAITSKAYVPLSAAQAAVVRDGMVDLLRSFDAYQHSGLLSALRAIGQEQAYCGTTSQVYVDRHGDAADLREAHRRELSNPYRRDDEKPTSQDLQDRLDKLPQNRRDQRLESIARQDLAARIELATLAIVSALTGHAVTQASVLTLEDQGDGISVGRWNDDASRVLLVYPDPTVHVADALCTMVVPAGIVAEGVPVFSEDLKTRAAQERWTGTNHHSVAEFMREMSNETTQRWMAGRPFTVLHSNPATPARRTYPAPHRAGL